MKSSAELKSQAKASLKGRWGQAVLLNLIPSLIAIALILLILVPFILFIASMSDVSSIQETIANDNGGSGAGGGSGGGVVSGIISALFMSGISWTYLDVLRGQKSQIEPFKDAFRGFSGIFIGDRWRNRFSHFNLVIHHIMDFVAYYPWDYQKLFLLSKLLYLLRHDSRNRSKTSCA